MKKTAMLTSPKGTSNIYVQDVAKENQQQKNNINTQTTFTSDNEGTITMVSPTSFRQNVT